MTRRFIGLKAVEELERKDLVGKVVPYSTGSVTRDGVLYLGPHGGDTIRLVIESSSKIMNAFDPKVEDLVYDGKKISIKNNGLGAPEHILPNDPLFPYYHSCLHHHGRKHG